MCSLLWTIFTVRKRSCGKVMFSQMCAKNFVHRGRVEVYTPRGRHPPGRHPSAARVFLNSGKSVPMSELQIGDHVQIGMHIMY